MDSLDAFLLGLLQALTEFLPVSSSGHIELGKVLFGVKEADNLTFSVAVHAATSFSTIVVFRQEIGVLLRDFLQFRRGESLQYTGLLVLSAVPVGVVGVFFKDDVENFFSGNLMLVGSMLLVTAMLLLITRFARGGERPVGGFQALIIGLAQAIAVLPGISRSGATIATGLMLKLDPMRAARFSFLMAIMPILGAALLEAKDLAGDPADFHELGLPALLIGFVTAFVVGVLACRTMLHLVRKGNLFYFAFYCAIIGTLALVFGAG